METGTQVITPYGPGTVIRAHHPHYIVRSLMGDLEVSEVYSIDELSPIQEKRQ